MDDVFLDLFGGEVQADDQKSNNEKKSKLSFLNIFAFIAILIVSIIYLETFIIIYFIFCGFTFLTINLFIYDWLSLFSKESYHIFLAFLANYSDFGLFFILSLFTITTIKFFISLLDIFKSEVSNLMKKIIEKRREFSKEEDRFEIALPLVVLIFYIGFIILLFFIIYKWIFYVSISLEILYLLLIISFINKILIILKKTLKRRADLLNESSTDLDNLSNDDSINNNSEKMNEINNENETLSVEANNNTINNDNKINNNDEISYGIFNSDSDIEEENNNDENYSSENENDDSSSDIYSDDIINDIYTFNDKKFIMSNINLNKIIDDTNANLCILQKRVDELYLICNKINHYIWKINNEIFTLFENNPSKKKIKRIKYISRFIMDRDVKINSNATNFNEIIEVNEKLININDKITQKVVIKFKKIMKILKNINSNINNPDNTEYLNGIGNEINLLNKYKIKKYRKKFDDIKREIYKILKIIKKKININTNKDDEKKDDNGSIVKKIKSIYDFIFNLPEGMLDNTIQPRQFLHNSNRYLIYKIIIFFFISILQFYSVLYPFLQGYFSIGEFFAYLIVKIFLIHRICAYNFIDICINWKKIKLSLKEKSFEIIFYIELILYIAISIASIVILIIISKLSVFPTVNEALYIKNNQIWYKYNNITIEPEGFCSIKAQNDGTLKTEDFAMMATLPRLYSLNKDGKCYLKPSKRGLFNTTMKYIFGREYEADVIKIMCRKTSHNLYLIITSDKILNHTLKIYSKHNYSLLEKQFNITNKNYFENFEYQQLPEYGKSLYNIYLKCISQNNECENEWDIFEQYYWSNLFSDDYENIPGFERYQINIESNMIIQPSFVTDDGKYHSGTHYIVGGGYEDAWNFGLFIETIGRKYIPLIIQNLLPFYSLIRNLANDAFIRIEWFNKHIFYVQDFSTQEMKHFSDLYNQFNFSYHSLFAIGHSISGTVFKVVSLWKDIKGIAFEAAESETNMNYLDKSQKNKLSESESSISNVFSTGTIITGYDQNCNVNGILPKRYILPNVYDTACLTTISCSKTMKYVPFCRQILSQNNKNPINEFNISFNSYLKYYGFI